MRTTIEISDELRARVVALAARRGLRGFSRIVTEALDRFLAAESDPGRTRRVADALAALGTLSPRAAAAMRTRVTKVSRRWRA